MKNSVFDILKKVKEEGIKLELKNGSLSLKSKVKITNQELIREIKEKKELIVDYLKEYQSLNSQDAVPSKNPILAFDRDVVKEIPLSYGQERLWFLDQLQGSEEYHMPIVLRLKGDLDVGLLEKAFRMVVNRHEILRTVYDEKEGIPYQEALPINQWVLEQTKTPLGEKVSVTINELVKKPFDLSVDHMLKAHLLESASDEYILVVVLHHIASDDWSEAILINEFVQFYSALKWDREANLPELSIQYADYAIWQREYLTDTVLEGQLSYWEDRLAGVPALELPTDHPRPAVQGTKGGSVSDTIDASLTQQLLELSRECDATLFMTLLSAFKVLLQRYSGQDDICVGIPIANRTQSEIEPLVGFFLNTLALRSDLGGDPCFGDVLDRVRATTVGAYDHQQVPFEKVVERVVKTRDMGRSPLFQVLFNFVRETHEGDTKGISLEGLELGRENFEEGTSQFDLSFDIVRTADGLSISVEYCSDLYKEATVVRMLGHYVSLLRSIVSTPEKRIGDLELLSAGERRELLEAFNGSAIDLGNTVPINVRFESMVSLYGGSTAVVHGPERWSYDELNVYANRVAHGLLGRGLSPGTCVGVYMDRSPVFLGCMLGIIKAGGVYVPLDTQNPPSRIGAMLGENSFPYLITTGGLLSGLGGLGKKTVLLVDDVPLSGGGDVPVYDVSYLSGMSGANPVNVNGMDSWAYVLFTSGSTGVPKGAITRHNGAMNHLLAEYRLMDLPDGFNFLQSAGIGSDISVWQMLGPVLKGGSCVMVDKMDLLDYDLVLSTIDREEVAVAEFVPTYMWGLLEHIKESGGASGLSGLSWIMLVGESIPVAMVNDLRGLYPDLRLLNAYGPCEASDDVIQYEITGMLSTGSSRVPIGKVIPNMNAVVLSKEGHLCPIGVPGEICVSGVGVGAGYLDLPERTAESFVANPFAELSGDVLYRTGDLGRWLPDGNMEFLGRADHQVKIRGHRVELEGIAAVVRTSVHVEDSHVLVHRDADGREYVVCFVVPGVTGRELGEDLTESLHALCREELPAYMHPSHYCVVEGFPVNLSDKVDGKALIATFLSEQGTGSLQASKYVAPSNGTERRLSDIWQELLGVDKVGIHDNFFELGGHSLLATRLVSMVRRDMEVELAIAAIFNFPTIWELAQNLIGGPGRSLLPGVTVRERGERIPLSYSQERLWFLDQLQGSEEYHMPIVLRLKGDLEVGLLERSFRTIVERHEVLRTVIRSEEGVGYQEVLPPGGWSLDRVSGQGPDTSLPTDVDRYIESPFDLASDYMLRCCLYRGGASDHLLVIVLHHIASDDWSEDILIREFAQLYGAYSTGRVPELPVLSVQYADYAIWQREYLTDTVLEGQLSYWEDRLAGVPALELPTDHPRPAVQGNDGGTVSHHIGAALTADLREVSREYNATLFMTLLSAFKVLLQRYSGQDDICVGIPIANRTQSEIEPLVGFFLNTLALRSDLGGDPCFGDVLDRVRATTVGAYDHQQVPFEKVVERVVKTRDMGRSPLFQVLFNFMVDDRGDEGAMDMGGLSITTEPYSETTSQFDLSFDIVRTADGLSISVEYCSDLYKEATVVRMLGHYVSLLRSIVSTPEKRIGDLELLSAGERTELLDVFNDTDVDYPLDVGFVGMFESRVSKSPDGIALSFEGTSMSYGELDALSNRIAGCLLDHGVGRDVPVGICLDRSLWMIAGVVGILKSGGGYVPIKPDYPTDRIEYVLKEIGCKVVLTDMSTKGSLPEVPGMEV
ncbi:amino acid adenylation domain-containing protein, partial [Maribacter sp. 2-571]|uniref:amino acid adenylation domain-containing protein n=1 Tax=Maribacter sp. 2-571 TaxID=3417569 RepID=UPI003D32C72F